MVSVRCPSDTAKRPKITQNHLRANRPTPQQIGTLLTSTREIDSDLPGFAKKLFKPTNTIIERREWRDAGEKKTCKSHIDVVGTPGKIDSNVTISPAGSGCTYDIEFEVTAKVPLIRKKLEEFIAKTTAEGMRDEHDYNQRTLNAAG